MEASSSRVVNSLPGLVWTAQLDGRVDFLSHGWRDYTGATPDLGDGDAWQASLHPDDLVRSLDAWRSIIASGRQGEFEARLRRHDGQYRWFLFRASPLSDDTGQNIGWCGINFDVDDRMRPMARAPGLVGLRLGDEGFRTIVETTQECVKVVSQDGTLLFVNAASVTMSGAPTADAILGLNFYQFVAPEDVARYRAFNEMVCSGEKGFLEFDIISAHGARRHMETYAVPIRHNDGSIAQLGVTRDMTERRRAEEALSKTRSELAHVTRVMSLGVLAASIAHEVNQPLSGIVINASTCQRMLASDPPNVVGALETTRRTLSDANRASDVIQRLRALFSGKTAGAELVELNEATREVLALYRGELQRNRVIVRTAFEDDLPPVMGDRVQLQQVLLNLFLNASDSLALVEDRPRQLVIRTFNDADSSCLSVSDNGTGFDAGTADKLFEAFYTTKARGMGIGLSVSRSIIDSHRGRLWAMANEDGPGATFSFSIPRARQTCPDRGVRASDQDACVSDRR